MYIGLYISLYIYIRETQRGIQGFMGHRVFYS